MDGKTFNELITATQAATGALLIRKGGEYANSADRLANFKRNAEKQGLTPLAVWKTYYGKHADSIDTYFARVQREAERLAMMQVGRTAVELYTKTDSGTRGVFDHADYAGELNWAQLVRDWLPVAMANVNAELSEPIEGRFHDIINYCMLCLALLEDMRNGQ